MDSNIRRILRVGLIESPDKRDTYIRALQALPESPDRIRAEKSLKDPETTLEDFDDIESGSHEQKYNATNIKEGIDKEISALDGPQNTSNLKYARSSAEIVEKLISSDGIKIDEDVVLKVDPIKVMAFARNGEQFFGNIPTSKSQSRMHQALEIFNKRTSKRTRSKILTAILDAADDIIGKEKQFISTEEFIKAFNTQLDDDERVRVAAEFFKIAQVTIYNKA